MILPINAIYDRVESFFLKSNLWVFATIMTAISLIMTLESEPYTLGIFLLMVTGYTLIFLPTFWFIHLRPRLKVQMKKWPYRGLWVTIFAGYPFLIAMLSELLEEGFPEGAPNYFDSAEDFMIGVLCIGMTFLGTATILFGLLESKWLPDVRQRITRRLSPPVILGIFSLLAAMIATAGHPDFQRSTEGLNDLLAISIFFSAVAQIWLIYLPYLGLIQVHHKFLYRKLFQQRGLLYYAVGGVATMLTFAPIHGFYARLFPLTDSWELHTSAFKGGSIAPENFALAGGFLFFTIPVVLFLEWARKTRTISLLEKEKTDTELNLLKQQVNPHFFFNTLNNLYSLSLKQAPETPETVLQLAELMRYVIYRAREERVELREEVDYLRDYLDLQRIRLQENAEIDFVTDVENPGLKIPPLLFIILVENAFKHGIEKSTGECFLQLELHERAGEVSVLCRNSVEAGAVSNGAPGGIGLGNLERRLELLYPDSHQLTTTVTDEEYKVELTLWQTLTLREAEAGLAEELLVAEDFLVR